jgi:chemotaxis protein histidine kinase CheA
MKRNYCIYALLLAYGFSACTVESKQRINRINKQTDVNLVSSDDAEDNKEVETPKTPTLSDSWNKVIRLKWTSLDRNDAWNIGKTITMAGIVYTLYSYGNKVSLVGSQGGRPPYNPGDELIPENPFGELSPEEIEQQREALQAIEQEAIRLRERQEFEHQAEQRRLQRELEERQERAEQAHQRAQELLRQQVQQQEAQRQAELRRQQRELQERMDLQALEYDIFLREQARQREQERLRQEAQQLEAERQAEQIRLQRELEERQQQELQERQEALRRQRQDRQNEFIHWQQELEDQFQRDLEEAIRQSQLLEDERNNNNASVVVNNAVVEDRAPELVADPGQEVECTICFDDKNIAECYTMTCCNVTFCKECLIQQLTAGLDTNQTAEVKCPNQNCLIKIEQPVMQAITANNKDVYERYLDIAFNEYLNGEQGVKQCPTPDCNFKFIQFNERPESIVCGSCQQRYCSHCLFNHPTNMTCAQAERERDPDLVNQASEQWIRENTKNCPNCNHGIQKDLGCNHMTCRQCGHEFCWTCLAAYRTTRCTSNECATLNIRTGLNF